MLRFFALLSMFCLLFTQPGTASVAASPISGAQPVTDQPLVLSENWWLGSDQQGSSFGYQVGPAGDVNGDDYADVLIGAPKYADGTIKRGYAFVFYGSKDGLKFTPDWKASTDRKGADFGSAAAAGDINGDGFSDVIVGAPLYKEGDYRTGAVFVYHGSASGLSAEADWQMIGLVKDAEFGHSVSSAGDVNGDGFDDVLIGAPYYTSGQEQEGAVYLYLGSAAGLGSEPYWIVEGGQDGANFGQVVSTAGDVNGDGYDDLLVGAPNYDTSQKDNGRVYLFSGSSSKLSAEPMWIHDGTQAAGEGTEEALGASVSTAGDVNGDGYADVIIGAPGYDTDQLDVGAVFIFHGSPAGLRRTPNWTMEGTQSYSRYGLDAKGANDFNHDGYGDVLIGSFLYDDDQANEGCTFMFLGSPSGLSKRVATEAYGNKADTWFGFSVAGAGDVNGDDYDDLIVGAPQYRIDEVIVGSAFLYYGQEMVVLIDYDLHLPILKR